MKETGSALLLLLCLAIGVYFLKQKHSSAIRKDAWEKAAELSAPYCKEIMEFIGFYLLLPPKPHLLFLTPQRIGVCIADEDLGRQTSVCLSMISNKPENQSTHWAWFLKTEQANLGGEQGAACFARLSLTIDLLYGKKPYPVIFRSLPAVSAAERQMHVQAAKAQYQRIYQKELPLCFFAEEKDFLQSLRCKL